MRRGVVILLLGLGACSAPNPLFGLGEVDPVDPVDPEDSLDGQEAETDGPRDDLPPDGGAGGAALVVYAGQSHNGSVEGDGCDGEADALGLVCTAIVPLLFDPGTDLASARADLGQRLGPQSLAVQTAERQVVAPDLDAFVFGPLTTSLFDAGVVDADAIWMGIGPDTGNCQRWTSGNDDRTAGVADPRTVDADWLSAGVADCGTNLPVVCLCRSDDFP